MFLHLPNFDLKNDMSWHAKRSKLWNILDSLHFNPQTGLARYNEIFDRDAFVYDRTRTWQQLRISFFALETPLIDLPFTQQSLPGTRSTAGGWQTAGPFGASHVGLLPGVYFYAIPCFPSRWLHLTKFQYVTSVGMHLTNAFYRLALFKAVFSVFGANQ